MVNNLINLDEQDLEKNIYRIYPLNRFIDLLKSKNKIRIALGVVGKTNPVTLVN